MSTLSVNSIKDVQSFDFANTSFAGAYGTANSGYVVANAAFGVANTALQNTSGTFSGTLTFTGNVIASNVGAGFTPPSGYYFVAGADIARGISVDSNRLTHIRYDNNGLNPFYVKNLGIAAVNHGTGINFRIGADGVNEYQSGSVYSVANGLFTSSVTANSHLTFGTVLQNNLNEQMRITDAGNVGIGTASPTSKLHVVESDIRIDGASGGAALGEIKFGYNSLGTIGTKIAGLRVASNIDQNLLFYTSNTATGGVATERMRISNNGYVTVYNQPKFWISGAASMTAGTTPAKMNFSGTNYDNAGGWSDANDRYTAPVSGYYYIYTKINVQASAQTTYIMIYKNGSQHTSGWLVNNQRLDYWVNHIVQLSAGDYVEIWISTAAGTTSIDNSGYFGGYLLG